MTGSTRYRCVTGLSIFLITAALVAGTLSCTEVAPPAQYNLTMAVTPGGSGTATDLTNASPYAPGTSVNIKAVANPGYHFVNWTAPAGGFADTNAAETTFTTPIQDVTVTANFALFAGGTGTEDDPYQIADWHQLYNVRNHLNSYFILVNNLDSNTAGYEELASSVANGAKGWQPIGDYVHPFAGSFDGQGYEITDLFINRSEEAFVGLFGTIGGQGVINNMDVVNVTVTGGYDVGGMVGRNCGTVSSSCAAGIVTSVTSNESVVGGLVGDNPGAVSNSYSTGNVTGGSWVGGLVGQSGGTVSNSYSSAEVVGNYKLVGGLVGFNYGIVSSCYATGRVTGDSAVGGLVGNNGGGTVSNSYAGGGVSGSWGVGGLVGTNGGIDNNGQIANGAVSNSYSSGTVAGKSGVGGLIGVMSFGTVSSSFWDTQTSGQSTSDGGTGKTTTEMKSLVTFSGAGWNIVAVVNPSTRNPAYIWNIADGQAYPLLSWQS
jgi:hypothetical protein